MTRTAPEYPRASEPFTGPERPMLNGFLDWYRGSFLRRCTGLTGEQLSWRSTPPSSLSLLGIARHLTDVERTFFRRRWGSEEISGYYTTPDRPDAAFDDVDPVYARRDLERLVAEQDAARRGVAGLPLDTDLRQRAVGRDVTALGSDPYDRGIRGARRASGPDP